MLCQKERLPDVPCGTAGKAENGARTIAGTVQYPYIKVSVLFHCWDCPISADQSARPCLETPVGSAGGEGIPTGFVLND